MFRSIKDFSVRIKVGGLIHSALEQSPLKFTSSAAELSTIAQGLVTKLWDKHPAVYNGTKTDRPASICIAASILSLSIRNNKPMNLLICYHAALCAILNTINRDKNIYLRTPINKVIIDDCEKTAHNFINSQEVYDFLEEKSPYQF